MQNPKSAQLFEISRTLFPGGVNSPVRAFKAVGGHPLFIERGKGSRIWDADGHEYIDFCCSFGPLILGHAPNEVVDAICRTAQNGTSYGAPTRLESELAKLIIDNHRFVDRIRFVNSGTEATMSAIRLARGATGRNKIIKFDGCYHGHADALLVNAGSGLATLGTSSSAGVPESYVGETIVLPLNDKEAVELAFEKYPNDIACIIIEPIPANNGLLLQDREYLLFLREICTRKGALLFFDEVISGFRVGFEGAAGYYDIEPDLLAFGKIIGGGLPVGAYAAKGDLMSHVAPEGPVYQAGTLSGNPAAMAAGIAQLSRCLQPGFYEELRQKTEHFTQQVNTFAGTHNMPFELVSIGSIFWLNFKRGEHIQAASQIDSDMTAFAKLHHLLLERGVYLGPSGYEVGFISDAHSYEDLDHAANKMCEALKEVYLGRV
ncbi:MAG: glutamate-1-semialdehyde 2,1-aminomutase [Flavobacteriales bacterium]|nr:glutamate-1-semialdehyde 2,1-aminomutase [Flavobacteriales bacterium]